MKNKPLTGDVVVTDASDATRGYVLRALPPVSDALGLHEADDEEKAGPEEGGLGLDLLEVDQGLAHVLLKQHRGQSEHSRPVDLSLIDSCMIFGAYLVTEAEKRVELLLDKVTDSREHGHAAVLQLSLTPLLDRGGILAGREVEGVEEAWQTKDKSLGHRLLNAWESVDQCCVLTQGGRLSSGNVNLGGDGGVQGRRSTGGTGGGRGDDARANEGADSGEEGKKASGLHGDVREAAATKEGGHRMNHGMIEASKDTRGLQRAGGGMEK